MEAAKLTPPPNRLVRGAKRLIDARRLPEAIREVETLHQARAEILAETAAKMFEGQRGSFSAVVVPRDNEFRRRFPQWKQALLALCRARIAVAEKRLEPILAEARARYIERYGLSDEEVEGDIVVRRARSRIARFRERLECIDNDPPEDAWQRNGGALLSDE